MSEDALLNNEFEKDILLRTKRFHVQSMHEVCTDGSKRVREVVIHPGSVVKIGRASCRERV